MTEMKVGVGVDSFEEEPKTEETKASKKDKACQVLSDYAGYCSVSGVALMHDTKAIERKIFWIFGFLFCLVLLTYHLFYLTKEYLKYDFSTKILLDSAELPFPSVTICNLNPIMFSKVEASNHTDLKTFLGQLKSDAQKDVTDVNEDSDVDFDADYTSLNPIPEGESESDTDKIWTQYYLYLGNISVAERINLGHDLDSTLLSCSYNGYTCTSDDFYQVYSSEYMNCWTFNSAFHLEAAMTTFHSGSSYGLKMELFADSDEYLTGLVYNSGFRISIHPFESLPFPSDLGFSISTGNEVISTVSYKNYSRLTSPYMACDEGVAFETVFNQTHNLRACQLTCRDKLIMDNCACKMSHRYEFIPAVLFEKTASCSSKEDLECAAEITTKVLNNSLDCSCVRACEYEEYDISSSSSQWPNTDSFNTIATRLCTTNPTSPTCTAMKAIYNETSNEAVFQKYLISRNYFSKLHVYFKDIMYQTSSETVTYGFVSYISDIGGTIGLWLGLSLFSLIELIELFGNLIRIACCK